MKKFMKISAIIGGIFLVLGVIVFVVGALGGGVSSIKNLSRLEEEVGSEKMEEIMGKLNLDGIHFDNFSISLGSDGFFIGLSEIFDDDYPVYKEGEHSISDVSGNNIELSLAAGEMYVKYHDEDGIKLVVGEGGRMQCYAKDNTVYVVGGYQSTNGGEELTVYLPENVKYQEFTVDAGAGVLEIDDINAEKVCINAGAGEFNVHHMDVKEAEVNLGMGESEITGKVSGDMTLDVGMGELIFYVEGNKDEFDYDLSCGLGSLEVEGVYTIGGMGDKEIDNHADKEMEISCGMGNVEVYFR